MVFYLIHTAFLVLLLHCASSSQAVTEYHQCIHDFMASRVGRTPSGEDMGHSFGMTGVSRNANPMGRVSERREPYPGWESIRISVFTNDLETNGRYCATKGQKVRNDFDDEVECTEEDVLTPEKKDIFVNTILNEAVQLHTQRLYVEPLRGSLVVPEFGTGSICARFTVPATHRSDGVPNTDVVLYVAAAPIPVPRSFAWAAACATLGKTRGRIFVPGRPVVGVMNYAPKYIVSTVQRVRVAAHEIAHALGFSVSEMESHQMVSDVSGIRGGQVSVSVVSSPNTLRETWWQYDCNTTKGMELEYRNQFQGRVSGGHALGAPRQPGLSGRGGHSGPGGPRLQGIQGRQPSGTREQGDPRTGLRSTLSDGGMETRSNSRLEGSHAGSTTRGDTPPERAREEPSQNGSPDSHQPPVVSAGARPSTHAGVSADAPTSLSTPPAPKAPTLTALTAAVREPQCAEGKVCAVEKRREIRSRPTIFSHWKRRNAKDELMVGVVGAGYYTALTMAAFVDLGYYMVEWNLEESMSWGNHSGCKLLDEKCVSADQTDYTDMFCTTEPTAGAPLQCTSDRHALGVCLLKDIKAVSPGPAKTPQDLPEHFQYFTARNKGSLLRELMDYCPFIMANNETWCTDGKAELMPGSIIAPNSRCVKGEELKVNDNNIGDVCVKVSCKNGMVSVKYKGDETWHACAEGDKLTVNTEELKGHIVCPKYDDVCNTINRTLDEAEGPSAPAGPETLLDTKDPAAGENPTNPVAQGTATLAKPNPVATLGSKDDGSTINTNDVTSLINANKGHSVPIDTPRKIDFAASATARCGLLVCLLLVTTMVAVS